MVEATDSYRHLFYGLAAVVILFQAWRGWRLGVVRQAVRIGALVAAYLAAYFCGSWLVPILRPLGAPDQLLRVLGGVAVWLVVFFGILVVSAILFKKTSDQSLSVIRWGYGALGALLGAGFSIVTIWMALVGFRLLGAVAQTEVAASGHRAGGNGGEHAAVGRGEGGGLIGGLAQMKAALEKGATGSVLGYVDPVPGNFYSNLTKMGQLVSSREAMERFKNQPGVRALAAHPKIQALQQDPEVARAMESRDTLQILGLMHNDRVVEAANDPEVSVLLQKMDLDKVLERSLGKSAGQ